MIIAEIIVVGREILTGRILDTNSNWLCNELLKLGIRVKKIQIVDDVKEDIINATLESLNRKPNIIIFTGGLGPTFDDITVESASEALGLQVIEDKNALEYIIETCKKQGLELTPERRKMALLPKGSRALKNDIGTAPGIYLNKNGIHIFFLPGVPSEMKSIFKNEIFPILVNLEGREYYKEKSVEIFGIAESDLAPIIKKYKQTFDEVYIKSHPKGEGEKFKHILLHFSIITNDKNKLNLLDEVINLITKELNTLGIKIITQ